MIKQVSKFERRNCKLAQLAKYVFAKVVVNFLASLQP